jgi:PKD repeat protein
VTNGGVLEGIGEEIVNGDPAQPIDVLALQEPTSNTITVQPILDGLNTFYSSRGISAVYAMSPLQLTSTGGSGGGPSAMVYNTNTVQLLESVGVGTPSGSGEARQVGRYLFAPAGVTAGTNNEFYVYVSHYKADTGTTNEMRRAIEAGIIRTNSASLPANSRVLYVGDYNVSTSTETSYQAIVNNTIINYGIRGVDPFNLTGASGIDWTANSLLSEKSETCRSLHYRFDFEIMSSNVYYGAAGGLTYVPGTYHTFGNNGYTYKTSVINANTSLNGNLQSNPPISTAQCYTNLYGASDHLPVVADYIIAVPVTAPAASFTATPTSGAAPLNVNFTDTSTGSPTGWAWVFGDGNTSGSQNPSDIYANPGSYTVQEIVTGNGVSSTNTQAALISVYDRFAWWQLDFFGSTNDPNAAPDADYTDNGMSNTNKFLAGFNPTNSAAYLHIIGIVNQLVGGNTNATVTYLGANGDNTYVPGIASRTNVLDYTVGDANGNYTDGGWQDTGQTNILSGGNGSGIVTNMVDTAILGTSTSRYYRVRVLLP